MPSEITNDEILGKRVRVKPRSVPFGYQVEQWERHTLALEQAKAKKPEVDADSFMLGWNAAFTEIYGG